MLARQRLFPVTDFVWCSLSFYVTFWQTQGGALCDHHRNIILCFDATPCLLWEYIAPITLACKVFFLFFLKHLSLGKFFPSASQLSYVSCVAHSWNCLLAFAKKQITLGPCQKSRESQQCCDNPRVKGVNMRREFHAWQVRRMAPVFSLFIHANEQYADEQTWAGPCLLHKNWQEACWCGSLTTSRISCVCCTFWWLFMWEAFPWQVRFLPCIIRLFMVGFGSSSNSFSSRLCLLSSPCEITFLIASCSLKLWTDY